METYFEIHGNSSVSAGDGFLRINSQMTKKQINELTKELVSQAEFMGGLDILNTLQIAYTHLLQTPCDKLRINNQETFCKLRDTIAFLRDESICDTQEEFECRAQAERERAEQ